MRWSILDAKRHCIFATRRHVLLIEKRPVVDPHHMPTLILCLLRQACHFVIALTHMRLHNDLRLAASCGDVIDLFLGGHDHFYHCEQIKPHDRWLVKSGCDFRDFTSIRVEPPQASSPPLPLSDPLSGITNNVSFQQPTVAVQPTQGLRPVVVAVDRHSVRKDDPELESGADSNMAALVEQYAASTRAAMKKVIAHTAVPLDARFAAVRSRETNVGNWVADIMRSGCQCDVALDFGGAFRADQVFPKGPLTEGDITKLLPYIDELRVISLSGSRIVQALENGVSQYPALDGRFPQVSGLSFAFDPRLPAHSRVIKDSVRVGDEPLEMDDEYSVVVREYIARGKDGYTMLRNAETLWSNEVCPNVPTLVRNTLSQLTTTENLSSAEVERAIDQQRTRLRRGSFDTEIRAATPEDYGSSSPTLSSSSSSSSLVSMAGSPRSPTPMSGSHSNLPRERRPLKIYSPSLVLGFSRARKHQQQTPIRSIRHADSPTSADKRASHEITSVVDGHLGDHPLGRFRGTMGPQRPSLLDFGSLLVDDQSEEESDSDEESDTSSHSSASDACDADVDLSPRQLHLHDKPRRRRRRVLRTHRFVKCNARSIQGLRSPVNRVPESQRPHDLVLRPRIEGRVRNVADEACNLRLVLARCLPGSGLQEARRAVAKLLVG
eukprot:INCI3638.3.p1 GENE.INCI3638.3~~INCI3638.3.p1  ORF type:complete len:664 (-),score=81.64 INCI3638.3:207-2198(-)